MAAAAQQSPRQVVASVTNRSPPGFTLLEVLVALVVLSLLLLGLAQGSRFVLSGWDHQARLAARNQDLDTVDRTLRRLIVQARPGSDRERLEFAGAPHSVTFTSIVPVPAGGLPPQRADIRLIVDASHRLLLVWTPHLHGVRIGPAPPPEATEILRGVERLDLAYWPAAQDGGWTPVWHDQTPPRLVRVRIVFTDADRARWPDILAAPILDPW